MSERCHSALSDTKTAGKYSGLKKIAIIGPANSGKSILFNKVTNSYSTVANYPHTTINSVRKVTFYAGHQSEVIDTPGISSLNATTGDEKETRDILIDEKPDLIIFCGDATRLKRTLILLAQIQELGIPIVFCLNKVDRALKKGIIINVKILSLYTGIPVVETSAVRGIGLKKLEEATSHAKVNGGCVKYPMDVERAIKSFQGIFPSGESPSKGELLLLLGDDPAIRMRVNSAYGGHLSADVSAFLKKINLKISSINLKQAIFNARNSWADNTVEKATTRSSLTLTGFSQKAAWASRHVVLGWPILLAILWLTLKGVGTIANEISGFMDNLIFIPLTGALDKILTIKFLNEFLIGDFGLLTMGVMNAIVTVVPILIVFFLIINFLEDVGYIPNLSVLTNRIFTLFGLTGKSIMPIMLGFGCNAMATLTSRMLETRKERIIVSFLIALGVPCSVQLGVMLAIVATAPFSVLLIVITTVLTTQMVCGIIMNKLVPANKTPDFMLELPDFHLPNWKNLVRKTYARIKQFLYEALPMFVAAAALMFFLEKTGLLSVIKTILRPVVTGFLSLPDKVTEVFILVLSRREIGAVYFKDMYEASQLDYYQTVVGLIVMTLFIPCVSNTMVMIKELGYRWAIAINISIILIAILVGGFVNSLIRIF